jgi:hypothetical protein
MIRAVRSLFLTLAILGLLGSTVHADLTESLKKGTPDLKSIGPIAFGPDGVVFVGDPQGGAIFAIDTGDKAASPATGTVKVPKIDEKVAAVIGATAKDVLINGVAVNPASGNLYLSVSRGKANGAPALIKLDRDGKVSLVELKDVKFARAELPSASDKNRTESITCLAYVKGKVLVSGLSNENWASALRSIPFPFTEANKPTTVEIFHGAHGKFETNAPIRTFVALEGKGGTDVLAAYTCTPLVKFPLDNLKAGEKVKGTTIAELGNGNRPLDMVTYEKDGKQWLLLTNSKRGMMKISTDGIDAAKAITERPKGATAGQTYTTIKELDGVLHMDKLDKTSAVILKRDADGSQSLDTVPLP